MDQSTASTQYGYDPKPWNVHFQGVVYDNYDDFQHDNFISSQNFISLF